MGGGLVGLGIVCLGASIWLFVDVGLNSASQLATIFSLIVGVLSLGVASWGVVLTRRAVPAPAPLPPTAGDKSTVLNAQVGDGVNVQGGHNATYTQHLPPPQQPGAPNE